MAARPPRDKSPSAPLSEHQQSLVDGLVSQFSLPHDFWRNPRSDLIDDDALAIFGDLLRLHHSYSRQALSKDRFEFLIETALNKSGHEAELVKSRTNRGHDITVDGVSVSLKTEAASNINRDLIHISKWMELGRGEWKLPKLLALFLEHMRSYERIFVFRCLTQGPVDYFYELVEVPKSLLLESETNCNLEVREDSTQNPKPGYGYVNDKKGQQKYALYFDGGTERKLQVKQLRKDLCLIHAYWKFKSN